MEPALKSLILPCDSQAVNLKTYLRQTLGNASKAPDVRCAKTTFSSQHSHPFVHPFRLGDNACAGYITLHGPNSVIDRRYMLLDLTSNSLRVYNNEREERQLYTINPKEVCNCYLPANPDEKSQHIFVVSVGSLGNLSHFPLPPFFNADCHARSHAEMRRHVRRRSADVG